MATKIQGHFRGEVWVNFLALSVSKPHMFMCGSLMFFRTVRADVRSDVRLKIAIPSLFWCLRKSPPLKNIAYIKILGELIFGSLHNFSVIHCVSRNYIWRAGILCVINGVGHYIDKFWGNNFQCHYRQDFNIASPKVF